MIPPQPKGVEEWDEKLQEAVKSLDRLLHDSPHHYEAIAKHLTDYARAYAQQQVKQEREACAKIAEGIKPYNHGAVFSMRGGEASSAESAAFIADAIAVSIRART